MPTDREQTQAADGLMNRILAVSTDKKCPECGGDLDWRTDWRIYVCQDCRTGMGSGTLLTLTESPAAKRRVSGDPMKRLTYNWQRWLAAWRKYGGSSSAEEARHVRRQLKQVRSGQRLDREIVKNEVESWFAEGQP